MRIEFDIVNDAGAAESLLIGDDSRQAVISGYNGPRMGVEVDRIRKARAEAVKLGRFSARALDVPFQVKRWYATTAERFYEQHLHPQRVGRKGVLRVMDEGTVYSVAGCYACEPVEWVGLSITWSYAFAVEDWKY